MALFKSYAVIYLAIGAAIYEVLFQFYWYPNDDTETTTFPSMHHTVGYVALQYYSPSSAVMGRS